MGFTMGVMLTIYYLTGFLYYPGYLNIATLFAFAASLILAFISYSELFWVELLTKFGKKRTKSLERLAKEYNPKFVVRSSSFLFGSAFLVWFY